MTTESSNDASEGGEQKLQKPRKRRVKGRGKVYGDRVTVTVRMNPHLFAVLNQYCKMMELPQNTYLNDIIKRDLHAQLEALGKKLPTERDEIL